MEIIHTIKSSQSESDDLYMSAVHVALVTYPSPEEQNAAILAAAPDFKAKLDDLISQAYFLGKKMKKADKKDMAMYSATPEVVV